MASKSKVKPSREVIRAICEMVSDEMLEAQRAFIKANSEYIEKNRSINADLKPTLDKHAEAEAEVLSHRDYLKAVEKGEVPRKWYDDELRVLEAALKERANEVTILRTKAKQEDDANMAKVTSANDALLTLRNKWIIHQRRAEKEGVDVSDLWVPGKPIPEEEKAASKST